MQIIYVNLRSDTFGQHKDSDLTKRTLRAIPSQLWSDGRIHVFGDKLLVSFDNIIRLIMIGMQMKIAQVSNVARNIPSYGCESCGVLPVAAIPDALFSLSPLSPLFDGHLGPHRRHSMAILGAYPIFAVATIVRIFCGMRQKVMDAPTTSDLCLSLLCICHLQTGMRNFTSIHIQEKLSNWSMSKENMQ